MEPMISDILIVSGIVLLDALVVYWFGIRLGRPTWTRRPKVAKSLKTRVTYDRDMDGSAKL